MDFQMENIPDVLIHQIMAILPTTDAIKFSVLSKSLRSSWLSFPVLDFDFDHGFFSEQVASSDNSFLIYSSWANKYIRFLSFIENSMKVRCPHLQSSLQKLRFRYRELRPDRRNNLIFLLNNLVRFALENNVKELDLNTRFIETTYLIDPRVFSLKSLTSLRIEGIDLGVRNLILTCPSLEFIGIIACKGFRKIRISSSCKNLREIYIKRCIVLKGIQVQAANLESFSFCHKKFLNCEIDIAACQLLRRLCLENFDASVKFFEPVIRFYHLKFLRLSRCKIPGRLDVLNPELETLRIEHCARVETLVLSSHSLTSLVLKGLSIITDKWIMDNKSALNLLENLELSSCGSLKKMEFVNKNLKTFKLKNCTNLKKVEIDARNMLSFSYCGSQRVYPLLITSTKCDARILFNSTARLSAQWQWFVELRNFLEYFDHYKSLTLVCLSSKELIFPSEFALQHRSPLYDMKHVTIELQIFPNSTADLIQLVESLLWLVPHPDTITLVCGSQHRTIEFCYSTQEEGMKLPCCGLLYEECWRHQTGKIVIQNFEAHHTSCLEEFFATKSY